MVSKMEKLISVIVPVYNTVQDLEKCLMSICNQTYKKLEIICVDDGSTDGSEKIVDEFAARDSRIKAIHQKNAGESNARNVGLINASGDYIAFCDCDDWIDEDMYETLLYTAEEYNLDMVAAGWYKEYTTKSIAAVNKLPVTENVFGTDMLLGYLYRRDDYQGFAYMWDKLYKREIVADCRFDENLKLGGDVLFLAVAALNSKRNKYIDRTFYHYNQRNTSGCHTTDLVKLKDWICAYEMTIRIFEERGVAKETVDYVKRFLAYHSSNFAEEAYKQGNFCQMKVFQEYMKMYENEYVNLNGQYPDRLERYRKILNYDCQGKTCGQEV